ncbi:hypothetical protein D3C85_1742500 [compost metagenome]
MALVIEVQHVNQLGITVDNDVRIMGHDDELTAQLIRANLLNHQAVDQMVVQVVFGLVEHEWLITMR